jgi:hypothetical protein
MPPVVKTISRTLRLLQLQNDVPALIEADQVERILADIDTDRGDDGCS